MEQTPLRGMIEAQGLPSDFSQTVEEWYLPLVEQILSTKSDTPLVLGVQGAQGSGKSTLALFIKLLASHQYQLKAIELSLDDFYRTRAEREALSKEIHPLLQTRGVPGTHDVELAQGVIEKLKAARHDTTVDIPRFNKAIDDRYPKEQWDSVSGPVDLIIFEGWCVGCEPESSESLLAPVNSLEENEDPDAVWRTYANTQLKEHYGSLFSLLDQLVVLQAPSFECVYEWRWLQEQKLAYKLRDAGPESQTRLLDQQGVKRFISHYERLTRHSLNTLPKKADWVLHIDTDHKITDLTVQGSK